MALRGASPTPVSAQTQQWVDERLTAWCDTAAVEDRAPFLFDRVRIAMTLTWLDGLVGEGADVLETGGRGLAGDLVEQHFPNANYVNTTFDLRQVPWPLPDASHDLVLCMEVLEHVCDLDYAYATTLTGVRHALAECHRVLRPGGAMLLTTPNATSTWVLQRALLQQPPWLYEYHFREFTVPELTGLCQEAGFELERVATEQVWHFWDFSPIEQFMHTQGYSLDDRGDDIFLLLRKTR